MAAATSLVFNIIGNNNAGNALREVGAGMDGLMDKVKKFGMIAAAGVAAAGAGIATFGVSAVNAASDLNETMSKSAAIFGDQAGDISKWGDTAAKALGLSKSQAVAAAAGFGDMFTQLGFGGDVAADMSKDVVQMAADLGSFNNLGTDDVADRLSAAFRGEYDSLQALIPNINAARVEQEAMAATGKTNASELTAQEKAAAVLAIVHADGAKAAGDFAKTSDGLANQQKILSASFQDVQAKIGTALLPVLTTMGTYVIDKILPAVQQFSSQLATQLGPAIQSAGAWITGTLVPAAMQLWSWIQEHIVPAVTTLVTQIMGGLTTAFDTIRTKIEENKPQLEQLWGWFKTLAEFITDKVIPIYADYLKGALEVAGTAIGVLIAAIGGIVTAIDAASTGVSTALGGIQTAFGNTKQWISERIDEVVGFVTGMPERISSAASGMWNGITSAFKSAINSIIYLWNGIKFPTLTIGGQDPLGSFGPSLPEVTIGGWTMPQITPIPLADGGIVQAQAGGILANIGEGRYDEAVIPLPHGKSDLLQMGKVRDDDPIVEAIEGLRADLAMLTAMQIRTMEDVADAGRLARAAGRGGAPIH